MLINGWNIYYTLIFKAILDELEREVTILKSTDPTGYKSHPKTKLLSKVFFSITKDVPDNPNHKKFFLGDYLGKAYSHWRRVKDGLPDRFRLFFQFRSTEKSIIYAWLNDENSLRKDGDRTDVYRVFKRMIGSDGMGNSFVDLKSHSIRS